MSNEISFSKLKRIHVANGDVYHGLRASDNSFEGFGELYFSRIEYLKVKGWKRHNRLSLNLMVPVGEVRFVVFTSDLSTSLPGELVSDCRLGADVNYQRLSVKPGMWVAFQGVGQEINIVANVIAEEHDPKESDNLDLNLMPFNWKLY